MQPINRGPLDNYLRMLGLTASRPAESVKPVAHPPPSIEGGDAPETEPIELGAFPKQPEPGHRLIGRRDRRELRWNQAYGTIKLSEDTWQQTVDTVLTGVINVNTAVPTTLRLDTTTLYSFENPQQTVIGAGQVNQLPYGGYYLLCIRTFSAACQGTTQNGVTSFYYQDVAGRHAGLGVTSGITLLNQSNAVLLPTPFTDPNPVYFGDIVAVTSGATVANIWTIQLNVSFVFVLPVLETHESGDLTGHYEHKGKTWERAG